MPTWIIHQCAIPAINQKQFLENSKALSILSCKNSDATADLHKVLNYLGQIRAMALHKPDIRTLHSYNY